MSRTDAPGSSDSACPSDSVQVTAAADGTSPAADPDLLPPAGEVVPVVPAGQGGVRDHRGGLGQRQRLAAERLDQVDGTLALGRVDAEPLGQAVERLADAEETHGDDLNSAPTRDERGLHAGDQHPAGRALRPEPVEVRLVLQVVQDDQPPLVGGGSAS